MEKRKRILITNKNYLIRLGLKNGVQDFFNNDVEIEESQDIEHFQEKRDFSIDLAFIEYETNDKLFFYRLKLMADNCSEMKIVLFSDNYNKLNFDEISKLRIFSFLRIDINRSEFELVLHAFLEGVKHYSEELMNVISGSLRKKIETKSSWVERNLSNREIQVLELISSEKTSIEIAEILHISKRTVEGHRQNLKKKLNISTNTGLIKFALNLT